MVKINTSKEDALRKRVYQFVKDHPEWDKKAVVKHFTDEGVPRTTCYDILQRMEKNLPPERKVRSSPAKIKMTRDKVSLLKKQFDHKDGLSQRDRAKRFQVHQATICRTLKNKTSIRYYKKKRAPKRTPEQKSVARAKCTKLASIFRKKQVVIDDESYFGLSNFELAGNAGFYSSNLKATPKEVQLKRVEKFEPKLLVWVAISPKGKSKHFIVPSGQAITQDVYIEKCLDSRLIPFLEEVHGNDDVVFWPDLATSHYSRKVQEYLKSKNVEYVPKERNIANCPELRPIEDFWSEIKRAVYANCWQAENLDQLRKRIDYCFKKHDENSIHRLGKASFTRIDTARRYGIKNL